MSTILSAYGSHNSAISIYVNGTIEVVEVERWLNVKNAGLCNYLPSRYPQVVFDDIVKYLFDKYNLDSVDYYISGYMSSAAKPKFKFNKRLHVDHHDSHAAGAFYQSPYQNALVITFDGGGDNSFFNIYKMSRENGHSIERIGKYQQDLGFPYMLIAHYLTDIKQEPLNIGNLVYAGKIMGLCSYGTVHEEWIPAFNAFYDKFNYSGDSYIGGAEASFDALTELFKSLNIDFVFEKSRYSGQLAWDIAATSQQAFENQFFKHANKFLEEYPDLPVCMSGGCALNVLLNTKLLHMRNNNVYVPPNTNDCGISVGALLHTLKPNEQIDLTYSGLPILDAHDYGKYIQDGKYSIYEDVEIEDLAAYLNAGYLVGVINGNSEHGSRALGNRSILCAPADGMKDKLNDKVKHREWYRPFAPVCRLEETPKYFDFPKGVESRHMVFVAKVRDEYKKILPAITHEDGTGRLQTVTREQNNFLYDLLIEFEKNSGYGVLLNTSFNDNGKPILTRLSDALNLLSTTELDAVYFNNKLIFKNDGSIKNYEKFTKKSIFDPKRKNVAESVTIHVAAFPNDRLEYQKYMDIIQKIQVIHPQITIVTSEDTGFFNHLHNVHYITNNKFYYENLISRKQKTQRTLNSYSDVILPLWFKESLHENKYNSKFHLFINLKNIDKLDIENFNEELIKWINGAKQSNVIEISTTKKYNSLFSLDYLKDHFPHYIYEGVPMDVFYGGDFDNMDWFCTNYEGVFRWYMNINMFSCPSDAYLISTIENRSRYKFIEY